MDYQERWMQARIAHYRAITPHPGTTCYWCGALATWIEIGEHCQPTPGTEWCYCSECGRRLRGEVSPWSRLALDDWLQTPYMTSYLDKRRNEQASRRIKLGLIGRRKVVAGALY